MEEKEELEEEVVEEEVVEKEVEEEEEELEKEVEEDDDSETEVEEEEEELEEEMLVEIFPCSSFLPCFLFPPLYLLLLLLQGPLPLHMQINRDTKTFLSPTEPSSSQQRRQIPTEECAAGHWRAVANSREGRGAWIYIPEAVVTPCSMSVTKPDRLR